MDSQLKKKKYEATNPNAECRVLHTKAETKSTKTNTFQRNSVVSHNFPATEFLIELDFGAMAII